MNASTFDAGDGRERDAIPSPRLWYAIVAPPAVWVAQGALGWLFGARMCTSMSAPAVRTVIGLISLAAAATAVSALFVGWQNWRRTSMSADPRRLMAFGQLEFMASAGFLISVLFLLGILWAGLSSLLIDVCGEMR